MTNNLKTKKRKEVISYLKRYFTGKELVVQVSRVDDGVDTSSPGLWKYDYTYSILVLKPSRYALTVNYSYTCRKTISIQKKLYNKMRTLITFPSKDYSVVLPVEDFIQSITTRADIIDEVLPHLP